MEHKGFTKVSFWWFIKARPEHWLNFNLMWFFFGVFHLYLGLCNPITKDTVWIQTLLGIALIWVSFFMYILDYSRFLIGAFQAVIKEIQESEEDKLKKKLAVFDAME